MTEAAEGPDDSGGVPGDDVRSAARDDGDDLARARRRRSVAEGSPIGVDPGEGAARDSAELIIRAAVDRCEEAEIRDYRAQEREQSADLRDQALAQRDLADVRHDGAAAKTAKEVTVRAARRRADSTAYREMAAADRASAATDREFAARDRLAAYASLDVLAQHLSDRGLEEPETTGAEPSVRDIEYELRRCRRPDTPLAVASIAIYAGPAPRHGDGPFNTCDFRRTMVCFREQLGRYDLLIRRGPGALVWAMPDTAPADARRRTTAIQDTLATDACTCRLLVGIAQRLPDDRAIDLIARADRALETQYRSSG